MTTQNYTESGLQLLQGYQNAEQSSREMAYMVDRAERNLQLLRAARETAKEEAERRRLSILDLIARGLQSLAEEPEPRVQRQGPAEPIEPELPEPSKPEPKRVYREDPPVSTGDDVVDASLYSAAAMASMGPGPETDTVPVGELVAAAEPAAEPAPVEAVDAWGDEFCVGDQLPGVSPAVAELATETEPVAEPAPAEAVNHPEIPEGSDELAPEVVATPTMEVEVRPKAKLEPVVPVAPSRADELRRLQLVAVDIVRAAPGGRVARGELLAQLCEPFHKATSELAVEAIATMVDARLLFLVQGKDSQTIWIRRSYLIDAAVQIVDAADGQMAQGLLVNRLGSLTATQVSPSEAGNVIVNACKVGALVRHGLMLKVPAPKAGSLSSAQKRAIEEGVAAGKSINAIANEMRLTWHAVNNHVVAIGKKKSPRG